MEITNIDLIRQLVIIIGVLVATAIVAWLLFKLLNRSARRLVTRSESSLDDELLEAVRGPIIYGVVLTGIWLALQQAGFLIDPNTPLVKTIFFVLYLILGYWAATRLINSLINWYGREMAHHTETTLDEHILPFFRRIVAVIFFIVAMVILLGHFNVNVSALVTTLGIGTLAIALAAQEFLGNLISGFVIMVDQPFRIGDRIEIEELDTWGDVQDITLHSTRILTRDHRLVSVPNALIGKNRIVNHSIPSNVFRVQTHVGVAYGTDIDYARRILVEAVQAQDWVMTEKPVEALFLELQDSGLLFRVRCWIDDYVETRRVIDKLNTAIYKALNEANIDIPFPQRVVHVQGNGNGHKSEVIPVPRVS